MRTKFLTLSLAALFCAAPTFANDLYFNSGDQGFFAVGQQNAYAYSTPDGQVQLQLGAGAIVLKGNEYVFNGDRTLSHLIWESKAPVLRGSIDIGLTNGFSVNAGGAVAGFGSSYMEDYDWAIATDDFDAWTHRSQHPDTKLDHYFTGEVALGYELANFADAKVRLLGGFKYTDVQWSSYGGSYVYSDLAFRDDVGNFADGEPAIRYRQKLPEIFIGVDGDQTYGNLRVGGLLRGGMTVFGAATDNHWMRDLRFEDKLYVAPTFTAGLDVNYSIESGVEVFLAGRFDQAFLMRGDTSVYTDSTGAPYGGSTDGAGADLQSIEITTGLKGQF